MRVTLGGKTWSRRIVNRIVADGKPADGKCYYDTRTIRVCRGLDARNALDTDIHEALHAIFPMLDEAAVTQAADELTALLYDKLGYRR